MFSPYLPPYTVDLLLASKPQTRHIWPLNLVLREWKMGAPFLRRCKAGVFNYVVLKPVTTLVAIFAEWKGKYGEGDISVTKAYIYCSILNNYSQTAALYCLILFYQVSGV